MVATKWTIDRAHSEVTFKVRHLVISAVSGSFTDFEGTVESPDEDLTNAKIHFSAQTASIHTGDTQRDGHLTSPDFFDSAKFPKMSFESTSVKRKTERTYEVHGKLTLHGETNDVEVVAEFGGSTKDPYGNFKAGYEVTGKLSRKDFGLTWNAPTEAGGVMVSDEVKIIANIQLTKTQTA